MNLRYSGVFWGNSNQRLEMKASVFLLVIFSFSLMASPPSASPPLERKIASVPNELKKEPSLPQIFKRIEEIARSYRQDPQQITDGDFIDLFAPDLLQLPPGDTSWRDCWVYFIEFKRQPQRRNFDAWKSCILSFMDAKYLPPAKLEYLELIEKLLPQQTPQP